ncbi:MAG: hypothetical protein GX221_04765 [Candidatus Riflebacteria bacterium]|mgnify:CR=1 FL=1|nr:hypothetical protein [Candidatus Riflebacteria bacterium]
MLKVKRLSILIYMLLLSMICPAQNFSEHSENSEKRKFSFSIGPSVSYKYAEGPQNFSGGMDVWGIKVRAGFKDDPKFGAHYTSGRTRSESMEFKIETKGLSIEKPLNKDETIGIRANFGLGKVQQKSLFSNQMYLDNSFGYFEPQLTTALKLSDSFRLEFFLGYNFADVTAAKVEGFTAGAEVFMGRF